MLMRGDRGGRVERKVYAEALDAKCRVTIDQYGANEAQSVRGFVLSTLRNIEREVSTGQDLDAKLLMRSGLSVARFRARAQAHALCPCSGRISRASHFLRSILCLAKLAERSLTFTRFLQNDMLAWRMYCMGAARAAWQEELEQKVPSEVAERRARIAPAHRHNPELREHALAKQEFVPVGRREVARW